MSFELGLFAGGLVLMVFKKPVAEILYGIHSSTGAPVDEKGYPSVVFGVGIGLLVLSAIIFGFGILF